MLTKLKYLLFTSFALMFGCKSDQTTSVPVETAEKEASKPALELYFGSLFPSGKRVVLGVDGDIYYSYLMENGSWSKAEKIKGDVNTEFEESNPAISPDGKHLYFTSNRKGGIGGKDIYVAERNDQKEWENVVNLGPVVNTVLDEEMPYMSKDGERFYFVSKSHQSIGGYDIFLSKIKNGSYALVESMTDVNTQQDDMLYLYFLQEGYALKSDSIANISNLVIVNSSFVELQEPIEKTLQQNIINYDVVKSYLKGDVSYEVLLDEIGGEQIDNVYFELQIGAGTGEFNRKEEAGKVGKVVSRQGDDGINRFSIGELHTLNEVEQTKLKLNNAGFKDAFMICYFKDQKSTLTQVLKQYIANHEVGN